MLIIFEAKLNSIDLDIDIENTSNATQVDVNSSQHSIEKENTIDARNESGFINDINADSQSSHQPNRNINMNINMNMAVTPLTLTRTAAAKEYDTDTVTVKPPQPPPPPPPPPPLPLSSGSVLSTLALLLLSQIT